MVAGNGRFYPWDGGGPQARPRPVGSSAPYHPGRLETGGAERNRPGLRPRRVDTVHERARRTSRAGQALPAHVCRDERVAPGRPTFSGIACAAERRVWPAHPGFRGRNRFQSLAPPPPAIPPAQVLPGSRVPLPSGPGARWDGPPPRSCAAPGGCGLRAIPVRSRWWESLRGSGWGDPAARCPVAPPSSALRRDGSARRSAQRRAAPEFRQGLIVRHPLHLGPIPSAACAEDRRSSPAGGRHR